jgi:hypothetical protein
VAEQRLEVPQLRVEHRHRHRQPETPVSRRPPEQGSRLRVAPPNLQRETPALLRPGTQIQDRIPLIRIRQARPTQITRTIRTLRVQRNRDRLRTRTADRQTLDRPTLDRPTLARRIRARTLGLQTRVEPIRRRNLRPPAQAGKQLQGYEFKNSGPDSKGPFFLDAQRWLRSKV